MSQNELDVIGSELSILFRWIANHYKTNSLERSACAILNQITSSGSSGIKALADEFHLDISTISRQAATLEKKGYVNKIPDPLDGRAYSLQITELGKKELDNYKDRRFNYLSAIFQDWSEEERELFGQHLRKFNASLADFQYDNSNK